MPIPLTQCWRWGSATEIQCKRSFEVQHFDSNREAYVTKAASGTARFRTSNPKDFLMFSWCFWTLFSTLGSWKLIFIDTNELLLKNEQKEVPLFRSVQRVRNFGSQSVDSWAFEWNSRRLIAKLGSQWCSRESRTSMKATPFPEILALNWSGSETAGKSTPKINWLRFRVHPAPLEMFHDQREFSLWILSLLNFRIWNGFSEAVSGIVFPEYRLDCLQTYQQTSGVLFFAPGNSPQTFLTLWTFANSSNSHYSPQTPNGFEHQLRFEQRELRWIDANCSSVCCARFSCISQSAA